MRCVLATVLALALPAAACTHEQAPKARHAGEALAISGVVGLIAGGLFAGYTSHEGELMATFSITSAVGILMYAVGEQTDPAFDYEPETPEQTHRRWAKILTERASGAAREGNCKRVKRLEKRVAVYNQDVHDFVFLRDPEIMRCLESGPASPAIAPEDASEHDAPALPEGLDPGPVGRAPAP